MRQQHRSVRRVHPRTTHARVHPLPQSRRRYRRRRFAAAPEPRCRPCRGSRGLQDAQAGSQRAVVASNEEGLPPTCSAPPIQHGRTGGRVPPALNRRLGAFLRRDCKGVRRGGKGVRSPGAAAWRVRGPAVASPDRQVKSPQLPWVPLLLRSLALTQYGITSAATMKAKASHRKNLRISGLLRSRKP
jgi:hypothetical protein